MALGAAKIAKERGIGRATACRVLDARPVITRHLHRNALQPSALGSGVNLAIASLGRVMTAVRHIIDQKGSQVWSVGPGDTVYDAIKLMADKDIGALMVVDDGKIVGIVTERDYARNVFLKGRGSPQTLVGEIMATNVACVTPDKSIEECMAIMTARMVRHLPVVNDGKLLGIVSIGDLVKSIISDREFVIEQLEHYISGVRT
jgi:CBS domain-containing protein